MTFYDANSVKPTPRDEMVRRGYGVDTLLLARRLLRRGMIYVPKPKGRGMIYVPKPKEGFVVRRGTDHESTGIV